MEEAGVCDSLYLVKSGSVKVSKRGSVIAILGEGSTLGELSFIDKGLPSATVTANEDCTLVKISAEAFQELIRADCEIAHEVYKSFSVTLCQKLRDTNEWLQTKEWLAEIGKEVSTHPHT